MPTRHVIVGASLVLALSSLLAFAATAAPLPPGGSGVGDDTENQFRPLPDDAVWRGEQLATLSESFNFSAVHPDSGEPLSSSGTFTSSVFRDLETGGLAFLYDLTSTSTGIVDLERVVISDFDTFTTDVYSSRNRFGVERSADGAVLSYGFDESGAAGRVLVRTDAGEFDESGSFLLEIDFEPTGIGRSATFAAHRPVEGDGGPGPNPIPLPPAAWAALATAAAFGVSGRFRWWAGRRGIV